MFEYYLSHVDNRLRRELLAKVFVVYDSKYDYTKFTSENILKGINEVEGIETAIGYAKDTCAEKVPSSETFQHSH